MHIFAGKILTVMDSSFFNSGIFTYAVLPILIFMARICDVSIGTIRIIFVSKGKKNIAPILGFFEVLIWITAISKIMQNLDNYINYVAYAAGFATGNLVGMIIEEKLAMGIQMIRVFINENGMDLVRNLNIGGFGATAVEAWGAKDKVSMIYTIVNRNELEKVLGIINDFNPKAFFTIEDIKAVNEGIFRPRKQPALFPFANILREWRGGK
jgi:uncharacterized protein YebE (UPF0316 family)